VAPLLDKGATLSLGCVYEPYLSGTPDIAVLVSRLYYMGFNYGEAACASQAAISWMCTVVGDPLYKPFMLSPLEVHKLLVEQGNPLAEWSHLRIANLNLAKGFPKDQAVTYLEEIPETKQSSILTEKLADLYSELGKPSSAIRSWEAALDLRPSPKQRIRLQLALGEHLAEAGRDVEAIEVYKQLLEQNPDYPDSVFVYGRLAAISDRMGDSTQALRFQEEIRRRTGS
jgi:tetratricopeptide (TPR) repeat protein